jgi:hypothetical protein
MKHQFCFFLVAARFRLPPRRYIWRAIDWVSTNRQKVSELLRQRVTSSSHADIGDVCGSAEVTVKQTYKLLAPRAAELTKQ